MSETERRPLNETRTPPSATEDERAIAAALITEPRLQDMPVAEFRALVRRVVNALPF